MNYLLVTFIPFRRSADGAALVDGLWAEDLRGMRDSMGQITVAAPELPSDSEINPSHFALTPEEGIRFVGLPRFRNRLDPILGRFKLRSILKREVSRADVVHSSNFFPPYLGLADAHRFAVATGKKTVFVVAEDFYDFVSWSTSQRRLPKYRQILAKRLLDKQDRLARECASTSSVCLLHTPASVHRYRLDAPHGFAIRQPVHNVEDVISAENLAKRIERSTAGGPLRLVAACRLEPLKGVDFIISAMRLLKDQGLDVVLDIYGGGPQKDKLASFAEQLGISDRVHLHGAKTIGSGFRATLEQSDIAMMPHLTNDFGRAFWDAMAAGLPVIAFRSVASVDTVRDGIDGLLSPNADAEGLADRIRRLDQDRKLLASFSTAARERALRNTKAIWNDLRVTRIRSALEN